MKECILLQRGTAQPLFDMLTGRALVFPDWEIAIAWMKEADCENSFAVVQLLSIDASIVRRLRKKIKNQLSEGATDNA